jgi:uncharacterized RDD family membrane protein YckC
MARLEAASASPADRFERTLVTPEGVALRLRIGDGGQRVGAFLIDGIIIIVSLILLAIVAGAAMGIFGGGARPGADGPSVGQEVGQIVWFLGAFLIRNAYFVAFELSPRAATPGKRAMGLRVAARDGGRLRAEAVFARNVTREFELFMPFMLAIVAIFVSPGTVEGWIVWLLLIWCGIFVFFPLFNRDRLRTGDLIGGTWVVRNPRQTLARDMADEAEGRSARFAFTPAQLDAYGVKELHVLEDVLRVRERKTMRAVADRIAGKIGWRWTGDDDDFDFLSAYYAGLRGRLEARLLMGRRRRDKHDVES